MAAGSTTAGTRSSGSKAAQNGGRSTRRKRPEGPPFRKPAWPKAYSFALVTGALFLFSWIGQFFLQMTVESNEASQHGQSFAWSEFLPQFFASTFENWQSEFLQLIWQAAGLALFYYWGSSQSRESDERIEAKLDALLRERNLDPENP
ncbi:hypothetical protein DLJ46_10195 [Micromonospora globispora]|uniref:Uncharacterized protein n=1 Tax=Micromonospora globispora TaxID=1450148 RepID=A0A317K7V8_9ACTN|nr:DUF6766 family protein [Micromonospora globispora]PWU49121.1 hypothetical protein DLJ46_10195 [Micromonospora globispora]RQW99305.1 hypothetical protein DKL51_08785 [Micromonospora globispora]